MSVCHDLLLISDHSSNVCHSPMIHSCVSLSHDSHQDLCATFLWPALDRFHVCHSPLIHSWLLVTRTLVVCITLLWSTLDQLPDSWWLSLSYDPFLIKDHCSVSLSYDPLLISCQIPDGCYSPMIHSWSVTTVVCHSPMTHSWPVTTVVCHSPMIHSWSVTRVLMSVILPWYTLG